MTRRRRMGPAALLMVLVLLPALGACASRGKTTDWQPGDRIICPHCGREFSVPEKTAP